MILVYLPISHAIEQQLPQAELELYQDTIIDDSQLIIDNSEIIVDNHKINTTKSLANKKLSL